MALWSLSEIQPGRRMIELVASLFFNLTHARGTYPSIHIADSPNRLSIEKASG